jgi:VWFA-related protein
MKPSRIPVVLLPTLWLFLLAPGQTSRQPLRHEIRVSVVNVPVYVTDRQGNPVLDLKAEDFVLFEGGREQPITHFALIRNDSPEVLDLLKQFPSARRHFFILFDLSFSSFKGLLRAREAAKEFVANQLSPHDLAGVATFSVFQGLRILCPFTADREQALLAVDTLGLTKSSQRAKDPLGFLFKPYQDLTGSSPASSKPETKPGEAEIAEQVEGVLREMRRLDAESLKGYVGRFIASFETLAQALNVIAGRKNLLYFSEGFDSSVLEGSALQNVEQDTEAILSSELWKIDTERGGSAGLRTALFETMRRFVGSDCAIHTVDVGGLRSESQVDTLSGSPASSSVLRSGQTTLNLLSQETGGYAFRNTNDLGQSLDFILRATNAHYLLGYTPAGKAAPGKFVGLKVQVKRPDLEVSYRRGFQGEKPYAEFTDLEKQLQLVEYISKDLYSDEIALRLLSSPLMGTDRIAQIPVFVEIPGSQFRTEQTKTKELKLEFYGYAINSKGGFADYFHQSLTLNLRKLGDRLSAKGLKYYDLFLVRPGDAYKVKVIVRDGLTGRIGSRVEEVTVPPYGEKILSLGSPVILDDDASWILTRGYDPDKPTGRKQAKGLPVAYPFLLRSKMFLPAVIPEIRPGVPFRVYFRAYHLGIVPETDAPRLHVKCETVDEAGRAAPLSAFTLLEGPGPMPPDGHEFLFEGRIDKLAPGPRRLRVTCLDLVSGLTASASVAVGLVD